MNKVKNNRTMLLKIRRHIRHQRTACGIQRRFLTKRCGISEATMDRIMKDRTGVRGTLPVSNKTLMSVADKLGLEWKDE